MEIIRYTEKLKDDTINLILSIQNNEAKINLSIEEQPDLLNITETYLRQDGNFWLAVDNSEVVGTIALMKLDDEWSVLKKFFVRADYRSKKVGLQLYTMLLEFAHKKRIQTHPP